MHVMRSCTYETGEQSDERPQQASHGALPSRQPDTDGDQDARDRTVGEANL